MTALGDFTSGDVLTAADLNAIGTWTAFTPTWGGLTVGNGVQGFTYSQINKIVFVTGSFIFGSTTSVSSTPFFDLPVARHTTATEIIGTAILRDLGTAAYLSIPLAESTNTRCFLFRADHTVGSTVLEGVVGATTPFTWTTNDYIQINLTYRAA